METSDTLKELKQILSLLKEEFGEGKAMLILTECLQIRVHVQMPTQASNSIRTTETISPAKAQELPELMREFLSAHNISTRTANTLLWGMQMIDDSVKKHERHLSAEDAQSDD